MRKNFGAKPQMYPMPVLIIATYNADGTPNAMNAAWGCMADADKICIFVAAAHKTMENILARKGFTVSMATKEQLIPADYVGIVSGNDDPEKWVKTGWNAEKSTFVDAPLIRELPMALECEMLSYDEESEMLMGRILNVSAEENILDENGKIDVRKLDPISYDPVHHAYLTLGEKAGNAFSDGKKLK
ncbi:MAG: flavin reductase family protein [Clostridia bacterium]|nr:flavin reductase family protein [Clostridia bacterium]